ncbi:hypothetical protein GOP47_0010003 [Adiantum capillus-veneris]|uniref:Pentatricopeptide repeat-containing protein n=1 Tax=Adiantum capillus-veneris TaxID=13818 RepID=A0A9D4UYU1_ADICA|nr:hypothetical protein GOP47_0010003 [Adiantum capillus-veneris]
METALGGQLNLHMLPDEVAVQPLHGSGTHTSLGKPADRQLIVDLLKTCRNLPEGKRIHTQVHSSGLSNDTFISNLLLCMYERNDALHDARSVFNCMPHRNIVTWNAMLGAYSKRLQPEEAFHVFHLMLQCGMDPNERTFVNLVCACAQPLALALGCTIHVRILGSICKSDVILHNALINMYGKCGALNKARAMFDDLHQKSVISWNSMIARYCDHGKGREALTVYKEMRLLGVPPYKETFVSALAACVVSASLTEGRAIHADIVEYGWESDVVLATTIIDFYAKFACLLDAWLVLSKVQEHDAALWTAILSAYSHHGEAGSEACKDSEQIGLMGPCEWLASLEVGLSIHAEILERGFDSDIIIGNALLNLYGKWGALMDAGVVFRKMRQHNNISWNAFVAAYSQFGMIQTVNLLMHEMEQLGFRPDGVTFVCFISACCREGLVEEAEFAFLSMINKWSIVPEMEHYNAIIDVLGRAGNVQEAEKVIHRIPFKPDKQVWVTLLGACSLHGESSQGEQAAESVLSLGPQSTCGPVLLSNMYASMI